jgi:beta-glucosidase-like glycosyl hydrolase
MLTPAEQTAWDAYVAEMAAKGLEVDLAPLIDVLWDLDTSAGGKVIADALGVGTMPIEDLAQRLTLQTRQIVQTGQVPN